MAIKDAYLKKNNLGIRNKKTLSENSERVFLII
jgi:hypothetical protein